MSTNRIVGDIQRRLTHCCAPHRHARITRRWARSEPILSEIRINEIVDQAAIPTGAQNPYLRSLLRLHQAGDPDASTVLMAAATPMLKRVAAIRTPTRPHDRDGEIDNLWGAFAHLIATVDPDVDLGRGSARGERPMLAHFGTRLGVSHDIIDPDERRHRRRTRQKRHTMLPFVDGSPSDCTAVLADHKTNVADTAIAAIELERIVEVVRSGMISDQRWRALIEHRVDRTPPPAGASAVGRRLRAMRASRQLSELVGHAA